MKKIYFLIALFIFITGSAQSDNVFGVKAGTNFSQFTPDVEIAGVEALDYRLKIGYYAGVFYSVNVSEKFSVQPELLFANQGTRTSLGDIPIRQAIDEPEILVDIRTNVNELAILLPLTLRYQVTESFFLEFGPQLSYAVERTEVIKRNELDPSTEGDEVADSPFVNDFDRFDAGINLGIGVLITKGLELNGRYTLGIIERDDNYKTSVISIGLGYKI